MTQRDPARIDAVLAQVARVWKANPQLRLMQLLSNALPDVSPHYNIEDDVLQAKLRATYTEGSPP